MPYSYERTGSRADLRDALEKYAEAYLKDTYGSKFQRAHIKTLADALDRAINSSPIVTRALNAIEEAGGDSRSEARAMAKKLMDQIRKEQPNEQDRANLTTIAEMILEGDRETAFSIASGFDTYARDLIPGDVWRYLGGKTLR